MQRVTITTLGCRLNQFESDALERSLQERGYTIVRDGSPSDIHILNSCTITHQADNEAASLVRRLHRDNPDTRIVVTGCYATASADAILALPGVSLVVGNGEKHALIDHLAQEQTPHAIDSPAARHLQSVLPPATGPQRSRVYLKIQDGCDYRCSFCIVPHGARQESQLAHGRPVAPSRRAGDPWRSRNSFDGGASGYLRP